MSGTQLGNRRSRCRWCNVVIAPAGGPWVNAETLERCCPANTEEWNGPPPHQPTDLRWKVA